MGRYWIHDIPALFEDYGLKVQYWPGWELRSRSSGGYDNIMGIGIHHDAGPAGLSLQRRCEYAWNNAKDRPIGCMWIHTDGTVMIGAAGATNTMGRQNPQDPTTVTSKGAVPRSQGNQNLIAIEMSNDGMGELWPKAQCDALVGVCAVLCDHFGFDPLTDIVSHWRYTPSRKIDPRGVALGYPSWGGTSGLNRWNDVNVGLSVLAENISLEEEVTQLIDQRVLDTRTSGKLKANDTAWVKVPNLPAGARLVKLRITSVQSDGGGFVKAWGVGPEPISSAHNYFPAGGAIGSNKTIEIRADDTFTLKVFGSPTHLIVDAVEWTT